MVELWTNRATGTLNAGISAGALSLTLNGGQGALFPNPTAPDFFWAVLEKGTTYASTLREIIQCTARSGDVLTIVRGQQGTIASAFDPGDRVQLRLTAQTLTDAVGRTGEIRPYSRFLPPYGFSGAGSTSAEDPYGFFGGSPGSITLVNTSQYGGQFHGDYIGTALVADGVRQVTADGCFRGNAVPFGGFRFEGKYGLSNNLVSTRAYTGVCSNGTGFVIDGGNPSAATTTGLFGFGWDDTSLTTDNLRFFHHDGGGGAVTNLDTLIPRADLLTNLCYFCIRSDSNGGALRVVMKDLVVGTLFDQTISTNIPANTMLLHFQHSIRGTNARIGPVLTEGRNVQW